MTAAEELTNVGYEHVAVLVMASKRGPGGQVTSGAGAQEEDVYRRTDAWRHMMRYKDSPAYPLDTIEPTAMIINDVTICRGPCEKGYPFLEIRPKITILAMAAQNNPALINDGGVIYGDPEEKTEMRLRIRVMCRAVINCGCQAFVVSAFGCGAYKHPPRKWQRSSAMRFKSPVVICR